ncbi:MAG: ATP-dependent RecD-like DNA helicase [Lachnospiraceae bacterium]|nr:ATP-dependent RecD-like DNA helicase [Lachnospiraceae bacterium]
MAVAEGFVERILFHNEENGYTVLILTNQNEEVTLTGTFFTVSEGEYLQAEGEMTEHPMYGEQMRVTSYEFTAPADAASTERYLASGVIKGIGKAMAARLVKAFGDDTFRIIEEEPERLAEIKGISSKKALEIAEQVSEKKDMRQALLFLQEYGISLNLAAKIYHQYGMNLYQIVRENPYRMAEEIDGVGFRVADAIAAKAGLAVDSDFRIRSGVLYTLQQAQGQGHTCLPKAQLMREAANILQVKPEQIEQQLMDLTIDKKIVIRNRQGQEMVYASLYWKTELRVARMLYDLNVRGDVPQSVIETKLAQIQKKTQVQLDEKQQEAVQEAVNCGLLIVTGGPGTGKTTTINTIIRYFQDEGREIRLAAPTGRAAKRMSEATGYEAQTIHRMLEVAGNTEESERGVFGRDEDNPLEADVIIIDEMSMVDILLMNSLLKAIAVGTRLILVGDVDQLPSVGPGNVLRDVIDAGEFPVVKLTKIFRQASESDIIVNAHKINRGEIVEPDIRSRDFIFVKRDNPGNITGATITLMKDKLPKYVGTTWKEIQVLTPMRKGNLGVEQLNKVLQESLNPSEPGKMEKEFPHGIFRQGDKVMQIRNNYQLEWEIIGKYNIPLEKGVGVFNGDTGTIVSINHFSEELTVEFEEGRRVVYPFKLAEELELAYAVTIHKSQGSEYPAVILPLLTGPRMLMTRNLLYTAVTRAKNCVTIVGSPATFQEMIANESEQKRYSGLKEAIQEVEKEI